MTAAKNSASIGAAATAMRPKRPTRRASTAVCTPTTSHAKSAANAARRSSPLPTSHHERHEQRGHPQTDSERSQRRSARRAAGDVLRPPIEQRTKACRIHAVSDEGATQEQPRAIAVVPIALRQRDVVEEIVVDRLVSADVLVVAPGTHQARSERSTRSSPRCRMPPDAPITATRLNGSDNDSIREPM